MMATKDRDTVQGRRHLRGVIIPEFKLEETDDLTEETKPCHKEARASLHCNTWRRPEECDEVVENYRKCQRFWKFVINDRLKKGLEPSLPPVNERQKVLEEYQKLLADPKPFFERPM